MPIPRDPPRTVLRGLGAAAVPPLGGDVIDDASRKHRDQAERAGEGCSDTAIPLWKGTGCPCPGSLSRSTGRAPRCRLFLEKQHHLFAAREDRGQGGLRGCVAVTFSRTRDPTPEQQPCCPGSHRDIPDCHSLLQPTGDTWGLLQGQSRSCRMRVQEQGGERLQAGIQLRFGSLFPR